MSGSGTFKETHIFPTVDSISSLGNNVLVVNKQQSSSNIRWKNINDIVDNPLPSYSSSDVGKVLTVVETSEGEEVQWDEASTPLTFTNGLTENSGTVSNDYYSKLVINNAGQAGNTNYLYMNGGKIGMSSSNRDFANNSPQNSIIIDNSSIQAFPSRYPSNNIAITVGLSSYLGSNSGGNTVAIGQGILFNSGQVVLGKFNVADNNGDYYFILGNGSDANNRSNILTIDTSGNLVCNNIPAPPTTDGTYTLQCTITNGVPTYSWV